MIAMIFEYQLNQDHLEEYKQQGGALWQILTELEGFISLEQYKSVSDPDKIMAIGFFESEEAVRAWRNMPEHRQAQTLGREMFFTDYRLRMAQVTRDYGLHDREQIPDDSRAFHDELISE